MEVPRALGLFDEENDPDLYVPPLTTSLAFVKTNDPKSDRSYRKVVIEIFWDNNDEPSVLAPLGDFFCVGHSMPANFQSLPFTASVRPMDERKYGGSSALNCYLTMPFNSRARVEVENQGENAYVQVSILIFAGARTYR